MARRGQRPGDAAHSINHPKPTAAELSRLLDSTGAPWCGALESVRQALRLLALHLQVSARHVEGRLDVEVSLALPEVAERDVLGVPEKPRSLVVERGRTFLERADSKGDANALTLGTESRTRRRRRQRRSGRRGLDGRHRGLAREGARWQIHACQFVFVKRFTSVRGLQFGDGFGFRS